MSETAATAQQVADLAELVRQGQAREARRWRVLVWTVLGLVVLAAVYVFAVRPALDRAADERATENEMFCDLIYVFGTDGYERCIAG